MSDDSFHFKYLGNLPSIESLKNKVETLSEKDWNEFKYRQQNIVGHKHTQTVPLIFDYKKKKNMVYHRLHEAFADELNLISEYLKAVRFPSEVKRANIVKLMAGQSISRHKDVGEFLESTHRLHIPIFTNPQCRMVVEDQEQHFAYGEVWELDNTGKYHSFHNDGPTDRVHLIVDVK